MERSLIQLSPSTAVVSLPASWISRNKLRKGAKLTLEENENRIIISAHAKKSEREITLDLSKRDGRMLWMAMDAAYTAGYDTIVVHTRNQEQAAYMSKVVHFHPGLIIEDERKNVVRMRDLAQDSPQDFDKLLARIFNCIIAIFEDAIEAMQKKDWATLADMKRRDYQVNMYVALALRHLSKYGYNPFSKTGIMYTYVKILEMLSDKAAKLLVGMGEQKLGAKQEQKLMQEFLSLVHKAHSLHYKYSQEALIAFEHERSRILEQRPKSNVHMQLYALEVLELCYEVEELESALHM